jgi:hypothetical protein
MKMSSAYCYSLIEHGEVLVGRRCGAQVAEAVRARFKSGEVLLLSFAGVRVASLPFVDELLSQLQAELASRPESMLVVYGLNASVREHVDTVLVGREMILAMLSRRGISLLGGDGNLRELMRAAQQLDLEFSADELAQRLPQQTQLLEAGLRTLVAAGALGGRRNKRLRRPSSERLIQMAC